MAHEIEGTNAFYVTTPAWHNIGTVLTDAPTIEQAWQLAYPHHILELPIEAYIDADSGKESIAVNGYKAIIRDDGKQLGVVKSTFETVQPIEMLEYFRPLLESGMVELEAGFSLREGRQMVALAKIKGTETDILPGDPLKSYLTMFGGFDGSLRIGGGRTDVRIVCANTLGQALSEGVDFRFKHTKNVRVKIDSAMSKIAGMVNDYKKQVEEYRFLAQKKMTRHDQESLIGHVLLSPEEFAGTKEISTKKESIVSNVIDLLDIQKGIDLVPAIKGTAWQAYNAITEYTTHQYGRNEDTRLQSQFFGEGVKLNQKALSLALTM